MSKTVNEIVKVIRNHVKSNDPYWFHWRIGITNNPHRRILDEHEVKKGQKLVVLEAVCEDDARKIEKFFLEYGMQGGYGGRTTGDSRYVYVFKE